MRGGYATSPSGMKSCSDRADTTSNPAQVSAFTSGSHGIEKARYGRLSSSQMYSRPIGTAAYPIIPNSRPNEEGDKEISVSVQLFFAILQSPNTTNRIASILPPSDWSFSTGFYRSEITQRTRPTIRISASPSPEIVSGATDGLSLTMTNAAGLSSSVTPTGTRRLI